MPLVLTKELFNEFIKSGEVKEQSDIFEEFDISMSVIESLLIKTMDREGNRPEEKSAEEDDIGAAGMEFAEGEILSVAGRSLTKLKTRPKPLYTEATLLNAMEMAGKQAADEKAHDKMAMFGLGTPATRAGIIEVLLSREYIERSGRSLIPTTRGLAIYELVKELRIADVELTGSWEKSLGDIEKGVMSPATFMKAITIFTRQITREVLSLDTKQPQTEVIPCPKCGNGHMVIRRRFAKCDNGKCGLAIPCRFMNKEIPEQNMRRLLKSGNTGLIEGFLGKQGKTFDACLTFDRHYNLKLEFETKKSKPRREIWT